MRAYHIPVLLEETIQSLDIKPGELYIDATLGGGGHTLEILKAGGIVLGIDQDEEALEYVRKRIKNYELRIKENKLVLVRGNFREIDRIAGENGFEQVSGILFDVGVSSHQLESRDRGFSFLVDGPLDMRMDTDLTVSAADLVNGLGVSELAKLLVTFGEEPRAHVIAKAIVTYRVKKPIQTTSDLVSAIAAAYGFRGDYLPDQRKAQISMRVFQALRIAVNDELHALEEALGKAVVLLRPGGKLTVISFHSLEDRITKHKFTKFEKEKVGKIVTRKPITVSKKEELLNRRSRSAKLRVFERI